MTTNDHVYEDPAELAAKLEAMTADEVFAAMRALEHRSETAAEDRDETLGMITLVEEEIERRYPGQMLAPYRTWKEEQLFF